MFDKIKALWTKFKRRNIGTFIIGVEDILTIELEYKTNVHPPEHFLITDIKLNKHYSIGNAINEIREIRRRKATLLNRSDSLFNEDYCEFVNWRKIAIGRLPVLSGDKIGIYESFEIGELITRREKVLLTMFVEVYCKSVAYGLSTAESKLKNALYVEEAFTYVPDKLTYGIKDVIELSIVPDKGGFVKVVGITGLCRRELPKIFTNVSTDWWFEVDTVGNNTKQLSINIKKNVKDVSLDYSSLSKDEYKYWNKINIDDRIHIADFLIVLDHLKQAYKRYQQLTTPPEV